MIYTTISSEEVVDRVIRRTRMTDATYADDILGFLGEFVGFFRMKEYNQPASKRLTVQNHIAKMPCGLKGIEAVVYNGCRLRYGASRRDTRVAKFNYTKVVDTYFQTDPESDGFTKNEQSYLLIRGDDIKQALTITNDKEYYITYPNYIQTSFEEGFIDLFYEMIPLGEDGFALIPNEEHCISAGVWYVYAMLTLTGYKHNDPRMDYEYCESKFKWYLGRGLSKLRQPNIDRMEALTQTMVNLIPPGSYYSKFFINAEQPKTL